MERNAIHMKTVAIIGAGQMGKAVSDLLKSSRMKLIAFGDNDPGKWTVFDGDIKENLEEIPVAPVELVVRMEPDIVLIGVVDEERTCQLQDQVISAGFSREIILLSELSRLFDIRSATLKRIARRLREQRVEGSLAELGVYKGDTARELNILFPERKLYLFDTFDGFAEKDVEKETRSGFSKAWKSDFSDTNERLVLERLPAAQNVVIKKGYFPDTADGLEDTFALVSLDADLYAPTLSGLEYFYPRLNAGGMILLHDYGNSRFAGVRQAVEDYEKAHGSLMLIPLSDLHGSAVIVQA